MESVLSTRDAAMGAGYVSYGRSTASWGAIIAAALGNWDLVGNNMTVFFIQYAMKFPDLIHAAKPEPNTASGHGARHLLGLRVAHARIDA